MLSPFGLSTQHMPVMYLSSHMPVHSALGAELLGPAQLWLHPPSKRQPLGKDLQSWREVTEASTQHLLLISLCVQRCTHTNEQLHTERKNTWKETALWVDSFMGCTIEQSSRAPAQPSPHRKADHCCSGHLRVFSTEWSCVRLQVGMQHSGYPQS